MRKKYFLTLIFFCFSSFSYGETSKEDLSSHSGNFMLPGPQQPGPLLSFGQNNVLKGQTRLSMLADDFQGTGQHFVDAAPMVIYGVTDNFSLLFSVPYAVSYQQQGSSSSGVEDTHLQLEYAFYNGIASDSYDEATVVTGVTLPTGSSTKQPPTGLGSPSYLLGLTYGRMYADWFAFTSPGIIATTTHDGTKSGDTYLYQFGLGKDIFTINSKWIFAWLVEADGQYIKREVVSGVTNPNSGGNVIYVTPSLWLSSKEWIIQAGIGFPAAQNLYGSQEKNNYVLAASLSWTI